MIADIAPGIAFSRRTNAIYTPAWQKGVNPVLKLDPFPGNWYTQVGGLPEGVKIAPWGADNLQPLRWLKLLHENNIAPSLLNTQVNFAVGERHYLYVEELKYDEQTDTMQVKRVPYDSPEVSRFISMLGNGHPSKFFRRCATDYYFSGNVFTRMVTARNPEKYGVAFLDHIDSTQARLERMKKGRVNHAWISEDWADVRYAPSDRDYSNTVRYKMWSPADPFKYYRSIYHSKIYFPGEHYYGRQPWHSADDWIGFANRIPVWMSANIDNSYNIKYHIIYPEYFFDYAKNWPEKKRKAEESRVKNEFDMWLAGKHNVGKAFYSKGKLDKYTGKMMDTWRIEPIKADINDRAFIDTYKVSQGALTAGFDVNPSLANIPAEGKFSTSGSELRIAAQLHQALKVQGAQAAITEPIEEAIRANFDQGIPGFTNREVKVGFVMRPVLTLDQNKAGMAPAAIPPTQPDEA